MAAAFVEVTTLVGVAFTSFEVVVACSLVGPEGALSSWVEVAFDSSLVVAQPSSVVGPVEVVD